MYQLYFAYSHLFFITIPLIALAIAYRLYVRKRPVYHYALTQTLGKTPLAVSGIHHKAFFGLRLAQLLLLALLVARPQWVDKNTTIHGEGKDIVLALFVYSIVQWRLRKILEKRGEIPPNQIKKQTKTPTLRWIFQMFTGIHVVYLKVNDIIQEQICGINNLKRRILFYFVSGVANVYDL